MSTANRPTIFPALALLLAAAVLLLYTISYLLGGSPLGKPDAATYTGVPIEEDVSPLTVVVIDAGHGGEDGGASSAAGLLEKEGAKPVREGAMSRLGTRWSTVTEFMRDGSDGHVAEMMAAGATEGADDLLRKIREAENTSVSEESLRLAREVCGFEEKSAEEMKKYLY